MGNLNFGKWFMTSHRHMLWRAETFLRKNKNRDREKKPTPRMPRYINFQCYFVISSSFSGFDSDLLNICCCLLRTSQSVWRAREEEGKAIQWDLKYCFKICLQETCLIWESDGREGKTCFFHTILPLNLTNEASTKGTNTD